MKTLNLKLDTTGVDLGKDDTRTPQEVAMAMIENIVITYANQQKPVGLAENDRRVFYKIADVFEVARQTKAETVELDEDWLGFIRKCFRTNLMPNTLLQRLEKELEKASNS